MGGHNVPEVRRQWCNALDQIVDRFSEGLAPPEPGTAGAGNRRLERTQAKLATEIEIMKAREQRPTWCRIVLGGKGHG